MNKRKLDALALSYQPYVGIYNTDNSYLVWIYIVSSKKPAAEGFVYLYYGSRVAIDAIIIYCLRSIDI